MIFSIKANRKNEDNVVEDAIFYYDNDLNVLSTEDGFIYENKNLTSINEYLRESLPFSPSNPLKKSKQVTTLKIQLGLSCNYSCEYCSQRYVERAEETSFSDIDDFLIKLENLEFDEEKGLKIEFWGGEPFVYWKTLKPLVERLNEKFKSWKKLPRFSVITNGSILNDEKIEWLLNNMDSMGISHDGPGQWVRGPDPLEDKELALRILRLYNKIKSQKYRLKNMSFNAMLNAENISRKKIRNFFIDFTGDPFVKIGEGGLVDAYDEGGIKLSLITKKQQFDFRWETFKELYEQPEDEDFGYPGQISKINGFIQGVLEHKNSKYLNQKCGMDIENTMAIDLKGNVITCQNVSQADINSNGQPHLSGNIQDIDNVRITTSTHWRERKECSSCPVLHICQGSCMFVSGEYWHKSCANSYSDAVVMFAIAFEKITGYVPYFIDNDALPDVRKDIFGIILKHEEEEVKTFKSSRKPFPVAVVAAD